MAMTLSNCTKIHTYPQHAQQKSLTALNKVYFVNMSDNFQPSDLDAFWTTFDWDAFDREAASATNQPVFDASNLDNMAWIGQEDPNVALSFDFSLPPDVPATPVEPIRRSFLAPSASVTAANKVSFGVITSFSTFAATTNSMRRKSRRLARETDL
ncbi:hypothetical protein Hte_003817 [Hypoxylon texense]